jgi:hypothetical protein
MRSSNLWQGVVGFWSASAGPSGYRLLDRSGRGNHGTLTNMTATDWVVDDGRYALDFDGTNDNIAIDSTLILPTGPFSICWWEKITSVSSFAAVCALRTSSSGVFIVYRSTFASYTFLTWRNVTSATQTGFRASDASNPNSVVNVWRHFAITGTASTSSTVGDFRAYENGLQLSLTNSANFAGVNTFVNAICTDGVGTFNAMRLADFIVFDRQLSHNEVAQLYQIGRGGMLTPRRRRRAYFVQTFSPSWASGSNVVLQPSIGVS